MQRAEVVHEIKHTHIVEVAEVESKDHWVYIVLRKFGRILIESEHVVDLTRDVELPILDHNGIPYFLQVEVIVNWVSVEPGAKALLITDCLRLAILDPLYGAWLWE
jgi:hypothetical protein